MCNTKLHNASVQVEEMKILKTITRTTSLFTDSDGMCNNGDCMNEQLAITSNLKSFSAFHDEINDFQLLRSLILETYSKYEQGDHYQRHLRTIHLPKAPGCPGEELLARVYVMSKVVKMNQCCASACEQRQRALKGAAPRCGWPALEALVVTALACWLPNLIHLLVDILLHMTPESGRAGESNLPSEKFPSMARHCEHLPRFMCIDFAGVVDLCRWAYRIAYGVNWSDHLQVFGTTKDGFNKLEGLLFNLKIQYEAKAFDITRECRSRGLCPNRLWNVSLLGAGGLADLPQISSIALQRPVASASEHQECTEGSCLLSVQNSTNLPQHHKCKSRNCAHVVFPKAVLNRALANPQMTAVTFLRPGGKHRTTWVSTAWHTVHNPASLCKAQEKYMAISHVWADGTGERQAGSGEANSCLVEYFGNIARQLGCSGIWWDAISFPTGPAKTAALDSMLINYENAAVTLVHDKELIDFNWATDGSPAVALILSSWFTRGWTAAELFASRKHPVKVLFRNPAQPDGLPLIKDLDGDILAWEPERTGPINDAEMADERSLHRAREMFDRTDGIASYGHFIATDIIRRLRGDASRGTAISSLRDLLLNLRARVTSWQKDRYIIPSLMCLNSPDSTATSSQTTFQLLAHFGKISCSDLCHGEVPIRSAGPWSWCPPSIFDFSVSQNSLSGRPSGMCRVSNDGLIWGSFKSYGLAQSDVVLPLGRHPALTSRVSEALGERDHCLLLVDQNDKMQSHRQYILASPVSIIWFRDTLVVSCRWAGCVYLGRADGVESSRKPHPDTQIHFREISYSNQRLRPKTVRNVQYLFGADQGDSDQPLPTMSVLHLTMILDSYATASFNVERGSCGWVIGTGVQQEADEPIWQRCSFPICFHLPDVTERVSNGRLGIAPVSSLAIIDESKDHNHLDPSVLDKIVQIPLKIQPCDIDHQSHCGGVVTLTWSFPSAPISDQPVLRRIFHEPFHLQKDEQYWEGVDICIGWPTYSTAISPRCSRKRADGASKDMYSQIISSCVAEDSADRSAWDTPLSELPPCHERQVSLRKDGRLLFDEIMEEQRERREEHGKETKPSRRLQFWKRGRQGEEEE